MLKKQFIIFIGPQGAGKTTQALFLKCKLANTGKVIVTSLINYTFLLHEFQDFLATFQGVRIKYFEDRPAIKAPNPLLLKKLLPLVILVHIFGYVISLIKLRVLTLKYDIVIEQEGFVFRQISDLYYLIYMLENYWKADISTRSLKMSRFLFDFFLTSLPENMILVYLDSKNLRERYKQRASPIEPEHYIQISRLVFEKIYNFLKNHACSRKVILIKICDAAETPKNINNKIMSHLSEFSRAYYE